MSSQLFWNMGEQMFFPPAIHTWEACILHHCRPHRGNMRPSSVFTAVHTGEARILHPCPLPCTQGKHASFIRVHCRAHMHIHMQDTVNWHPLMGLQDSLCEQTSEKEVVGETTPLIFPCCTCSSLSRLDLLLTWLLAGLLAGLRLWLMSFFIYLHTGQRI